MDLVQVYIEGQSPEARAADKRVAEKELLVYAENHRALMAELDVAKTKMIEIEKKLEPMLAPHKEKIGKLKLSKMIGSKRIETLMRRIRIANLRVEGATAKINKNAALKRIQPDYKAIAEALMGLSESNRKMGEELKEAQLEEKASRIALELSIEVQLESTGMLSKLQQGVRELISSGLSFYDRLIGGSLKELEEGSKTLAALATEG